MSDLPPPPPPPDASPPPPPATWATGSMPPPPAAATNALTGPPAGVTGLRKAAVILYWVTTASLALFVIAVVSRRSVWADFESGGDVSFSDLDNADGFVGGMLVLTVVLSLAATIVVSIWALRVARNAVQAGATGVNPGLACGGWYIPLANTVVPFLQLRRVAEHGRRPTQLLNIWMGLAIATLVLSIIFRIAAGGDIDLDDDVSGVLTRQVVFSVLILITVAAMSFVAMRAMREVDGA